MTPVVMVYNSVIIVTGFADGTSSSIVSPVANRSFTSQPSSASLPRTPIITIQLRSLRTVTVTVTAPLRSVPRTPIITRQLEPASAVSHSDPSSLGLEGSVRQLQTVGHQQFASRTSPPVTPALCQLATVYSNTGTVTPRRRGCPARRDDHSPRGKIRKLCCIASLKGLRLVHFFRGPLKELANAISGPTGSPQAAARR
jgi:hypothetical protein